MVQIPDKVLALQQLSDGAGEPVVECVFALYGIDLGSGGEENCIPACASGQKALRWGGMATLGNSPFVHVQLLGLEEAFSGIVARHSNNLVLSKVGAEVTGGRLVLGCQKEVFPVFVKFPGAQDGPSMF